MIGIVLITVSEAIGNNEENGFGLSFLSEDNNDDYVKFRAPFGVFERGRFLLMIYLI